MVQIHHVAKRLKVEECSSCTESVMFNNDSLFKIASYLPADCLLSLALTCRRFGVASVSDGDGNDSLSLVEEFARVIVEDIATEEEKKALPCYDEDNWLCKYNYLQLLRIPLTFDQLVGRTDYVEGNKSRITRHRDLLGWSTAFSNKIMMAGKHYVSFEAHHERNRLTFSMGVEIGEYNGIGLLAGVMRPGEAMQSAKGSPLRPDFYNRFTQRKESLQYSNSVNCCMYGTCHASCFSHDWGEGSECQPWDGMESLSPPYKIGMLLDLDEGTLSVYKNGRKLGVMKRGLAGHYCWVVAIGKGFKVTIKRGTVPEN